MKGHKNDYKSGLHLRLTEGMSEKIRLYSERHGITASETVRRACTLFFFEDERLQEKRKTRAK